ncbi:MAG: ugp [Verrucomicrobiales bacterium]|nr:ugp [Verrucomicrobiales bacterium]
MQPKLVSIITSGDPVTRNTALESVCEPATPEELLAECASLENFRKESNNLYEKVRALFFLHAIHRFHLPKKIGFAQKGLIPFHAYEKLMQRRFEESVEDLLQVQEQQGASDSISSGLAAAYQKLGIQTLANQVRKSVRSVKGNQWMFRMGHPLDQPLRIHPRLLEKNQDGSYPILRELTPVRMDLTHSAWSDIFFLGMDYPEGARVLNVSIDLAVKGRDEKPKPPVEVYLRVIEEPVLRLVSIDLGAVSEVTHLTEVFDFARDYLGLLKAAVIASGIVPPGLEGSGLELADLLARVAGKGRGLELVSSVNDIPKGSRLAVSTNLLAGLIAVCMRATGQAESLEGPLTESERRLVVARAILGEWLGGSGGGWQDSGGLWPGVKLIEGANASEADPEYRLSRGRLLPRHQVLGENRVSAGMKQKLQASLVLVHGGMAQNVGPILEMVTEKYLLRSSKEWEGRQQALAILGQVLKALKEEDVRKLGEATTANFTGPLQSIIPWATNYYTESLIRLVRAEFGADFWGFWMLGGMSGGGMGFIFAPHRKVEAQEKLQEIMSRQKRLLENSLPFAMNPVVYDFSINETGTASSLLVDDQSLMPRGYYPLMVPPMLREDPRKLDSLRRLELDRFAAACRTDPGQAGMVQVLFDRLLPKARLKKEGEGTLQELLGQNGFDRAQHEQIRSDLRHGLIGLAQNRLPANSEIRDVQPGDVADFSSPDSKLVSDRALIKKGEYAISHGEVAMVSLSAGVGSRWTQGAGVVKALHPFSKFKGKHRTFLEVHLAKSRKTSQKYHCEVPHIFTTSYLTHEATLEFLKEEKFYGYEKFLRLSPGRSIGLRMVPMVRDLRFAWEETQQQVLDEQAQKVRDSLRTALIGWARNAGEASDYTDNLPQQCLHPVGHWYEIPNLLRNGVLLELLQERPQLKYLLLHNIDTLGANLDPAILGYHIESKSALTFEMITRRVEDKGGGLARVNGKLRLVEGLAIPREEQEFTLSYYNTMTTWINISMLLEAFGLAREDLGDQAKVASAIRKMGSRMPTYVTIKDVKKRWGHGQEDVFPVTQFEKLWSDMSTLPDLGSNFLVVPRYRGQQLKEQSQLDGWLGDGSSRYVDELCQWE